jgi:hypothetical protein
VCVRADHRGSDADRVAACMQSRFSGLAIGHQSARYHVPNYHLPHSSHSGGQGCGRGVAFSVTSASLSTLYNEGRPVEALEEHRRLLHAIEAREADRAESIARGHRRKTLKLRKDMLRAQLRKRCADGSGGPPGRAWKQIISVEAEHHPPTAKSSAGPTENMKAPPPIAAASFSP